MKIIVVLLIFSLLYVNLELLIPLKKYSFNINYIKGYWSKKYKNDPRIIYNFYEKEYEILNYSKNNKKFIVLFYLNNNSINSILLKDTVIFNVSNVNKNSFTVNYKETEEIFVRIEQFDSSLIEK